MRFNLEWLHMRLIVKHVRTRTSSESERMKRTRKARDAERRKRSIAPFDA